MAPAELWSKISLVILMMMLVLVGYLKSVDHDNPRYTLEWGASAWLTSEEESASAYFRSTFYVDSDVEKAVLQIAATDSYEVYVNGVRLGKRTGRSLLVAGVYDVGHLVGVGRNVLAVAVSRSTFPPQPGLRFEISSIDNLGRVSVFASNQKTHVQNLYPAHTELGYNWTELDFDDAGWATGRIWFGASDITRVDFDPNVLLALPQPTLKSILSTSWRVSAEKRFYFDGSKYRHAWVGFASNVPYEIILNDKSLGIFTSSLGAVDLQAIHARLSNGWNDLKIEFLSSGETGNAAGGIVLSGVSYPTTISLDSSWRLSGSDMSGDSPLLELSKVSAGSSAALADSPRSGAIPYHFQEQFVMPRLLQIAPFLAPVVYFLGMLAIYLGVFRRSFNWVRIIEASLLPNFLTLVCIFSAWLLAQDIRFDARSIFSDFNMFLLFAMWWLLLFARISELLLRRPVVRRRRRRSGYADL